MPVTATVKRFVALPLAMLLSSFPVCTLAEGAVRLLDCIVTQRCDGNGSCAIVSERTRFRMQPVNLSEDGSGHYELSHENETADMQALSYAGPFHWSSNKERNTLLASSETEFLWHRLTLDPAPAADIQFMSCIFSQ